MIRALLILSLIFAPAQKLSGPVTIAGPVTIPAPASGGPTYVVKQTCFNTVAASSTATCAFGSNLTAGSMIVAYGGDTTAGHTFTFSGCSLTWTGLDDTGGTADATAPNAGTAACTVTITNSGTGLTQMAVAEITGSATNTVDKHSFIATSAFNQITTPNPIVATSVTTTVANDLVVEIVQGWSAGGSTYTAISGTLAGSNPNTEAMIFQIQTQVTAGAVAPSLKSNTTDYFVVAAIAIKP